MKDRTLRLKNYLKFSSVLVVIVVVINLKFILSKRLEQKNFLKMQNAHMVIDQLWVIQHGVIWIRIVPFKKCMIFAIIPNVFVRNKELLLQSNFNWKVVR